jgi:hypothetical protein
MVVDRRHLKGTLAQLLYLLGKDGSGG